MLKHVNQMQQQWGGASRIIDHWLAARKELIVEYCSLIGQKKAKMPQKLPEIRPVTRFCHHIVDYVSTGHFRIYEQIIQASGDQQLIDAYLTQLPETTDKILDFYDRYNEIATSNELNNFYRDLSLIGEILEQRFAIEDVLLERLYQYINQPQLQD